MTELLTFSEAVADAPVKPHLLLGNGFSRACRNDLFAYDALYEKAKDQLGPRVERAFEVLETTDFEEVMRALKQAERLVKTYAVDSGDLAERFNCDANSLRTTLATVIASNHPERSNEIPNGQFTSCRTFLSKFKNYYTLNYDLLLYWVLMKDDIDNVKLSVDDGFRYPEDELTDYVVWDLGDYGQQNVFYLHGALHLFDAGSEVQKYTWINTKIALIDQIREALELERYPVFVSEGTSESKLSRVMHSSYLIRGYRSLSQVGGSLFIFGHSLHDNDRHVLRCITRSKVSHLYVSIFGDPESSENQDIIQRAQSLSMGRLQSRRSSRTNLNIKFYDASSANVWND